MSVVYEPYISIVYWKVEIKFIILRSEEFDCLLKISRLSSFSIWKTESRVNFCQVFMLTKYTYLLFHILGLWIYIQVTEYQSSIILKCAENIVHMKLMNTSSDVRHHDLLYMHHILTERIKLQQLKLLVCEYKEIHWVLRFYEGKSNYFTNSFVLKLVLFNIVSLFLLLL